MASNNQVKIKLCSINISGFSQRSKLTLDQYVDTEGFDIVVVQETGTSDLTKLKLSNMNCITDLNMAQNRGSALFMKVKYSLARLDQISCLSKNMDSAWGLGIINNNKYIIGTVYCKLNHDSAIEEINTMLTKAKTISAQLKAKGVILIGDLNSRHEYWGDSLNNKYGQDLIRKLDFSQYSILAPQTPTFITETGSSVIDLLIVSNNLVEKVERPKTDAEVELYSGAPFRGHLPVITNIISGVPQENQIRKEKNSLDGVNWALWSNDLESELTNHEHQITNSNEETSLIKVLDSAIEKVSATHTKKKVITNHSKPYWTPRLSRLSQALRDARKKYKKRNTDTNKQDLIEAKENFDTASKEECQEFILSKTKNLNTLETAKFWKEFKKLFTSRKDGKVDPLDDGKGGFLTKETEIEEELFSTFFKGKHLEKERFDEDFLQEIHGIYEDIINDRYIYDGEDRDILNREITEAEIRKEIKRYENNGKSADNHEFHPTMLKNFGEKALHLLHKIINLCLTNANWLWQDSVIIFLKKEGKDSYASPGAYRPISITSYIGKIFEKIIARRLSEHYQNKGLLDPDQEGFTESRNTGRYLNRLHLSIKSDIKQGKTSIAVFVDMEKAFDSIWKEGLIVKLAKDGVKGNILKLINSFLMTRTVKLNVNGIAGPVRECADVGLPQGSALSPILFKIFLMDLAGELENETDVEVYKFADDGTLKATGSTTPLCLETVKVILDTVHEWSRKWRMVINCNRNKSEVIAFSTAENNRDLVPKTFKIGNKEIQRVAQTKVLGLVIDENLTYLPHSREVHKKLLRKWVLICQYCSKNWGFSQKVLIQLIRTLFLSTLFYAGHIWINDKTMKDINTLWYKILKSTVGAVFNIRLSLAEVILGLAPLNIVNSTNQIKHYLKINIRKVEADRLKEFIESCSSDIHNKMPADLYTALRKVFRYLKWKTLQYPKSFNTEDLRIINENNIERFCDLSCNACKYTKDMMKKYIQCIWSESLKYEFQAEGHTYLPKPKCDPLPVPKDLTRREEVLLMSLCYTNNLLNGFLHRYDSRKFPDPLCHCGEEEQTNYHIAAQCTHLNANDKAELMVNIKTVLGERNAVSENPFIFLNSSRDPKVLNILANNIKSQSQYLRQEIEL